MFKKIIQFISLGNKVATILGKMLPALLAICSFCGCLIVFVCLYLWCWELDVDLTVPISEFTYSLCLKWPEFLCFVSAACQILALCSHVQNAKNGFIQGDKISHNQYHKSNYLKKKNKKNQVFRLQVKNQVFRLQVIRDNQLKLWFTI